MEGYEVTNITQQQIRSKIYCCVYMLERKLCRQSAYVYTSMAALDRKIENKKWFFVLIKKAIKYMS